MNLILASNSPRRKELLSKLNYPFTVVPSTCKEVTYATNPVDVVKELAMLKALDVFKQHPNSVVIGSDTVVDLHGKILGKPHSKDVAMRMLGDLSAQVHQVHTGVCVMCATGVWLFATTTDVQFYDLSASQIEQYVDSGSAYDKAGAYGIQDSGFVQSIKGDYDNVVGLPTKDVQQVLKQIYKR